MTWIFCCLLDYKWVHVGNWHWICCQGARHLFYLGKTAASCRHGSCDICCMCISMCYDAYVFAIICICILVWCIIFVQCMYVYVYIYIYTYYDIWFDIWYEPWPGVEVFMVKDNSWALEDLTGGSWQWGDGLTVLPSHDKKSLLSPKILSPPKDRRVWKPSSIYQSLSVYHVGNTGSPTQIWLNFERFGLPHYAAVLAGTALRLNISRDLLRL